MIIGTFVIQWFPIHAFYLYLSLSNYYNIELEVSNYEIWMTVLFFISHWLSMSNSFVNPVIYSYMNNVFRVIFKKKIFSFFYSLCFKNHFFKLICILSLSLLFFKFFN